MEKFRLQNLQKSWNSTPLSLFSRQEHFEQNLQKSWNDHLLAGIIQGGHIKAESTKELKPTPLPPCAAVPGLAESTKELKQIIKRAYQAWNQIIAESTKELKQKNIYASEWDGWFSAESTKELKLRQKEKNPAEFDVVQNLQKSWNRLYLTQRWNCR